MSIYATNPRTWAQLDALDARERRALLDGQFPGGSAASPGQSKKERALAFGPRGVLRYFSSPDRDAQVASYFYPSDPAAGPAKAVVLAVHGHGSYWQFEFLKMAVCGEAHRYEGSWVESLNSRGYSVCGVDNCGAGRSSGRFGLVERAEDLRDDVLALAACVRGMGGTGGAAPPAAPPAAGRKRGGAAAAAAAAASAPSSAFGPALAGIPGFCSTLPLFLLGPSLGGCVSVQAALAAEARLSAAAAAAGSGAAAVSSSSPFAGVVLLAPLLGLEGTASRGWNPVLRRAAALLDALPWTREWPVAAQEGNRMFPEQQLDFECDPVTYHYPCRVRTAVQLLRACAGVLPLPAAAAAAAGGAAAAAASAAAAAAEQRAGQPLREAAGRLRAPVLAFHSARDTLCDCAATEAFVAAARDGQERRRAAAAAAAGGAAAAAAEGGKAGGGARAAAAAASPAPQMRRCDHLWHSVLREDGTGELLREAVAWMDARLAAAAAAAAAGRHGAAAAAAAPAAAAAKATAAAAAPAAPAAAKAGRGGAGSLKQSASAAARVTVGAASPAKAAPAAAAEEDEAAAPPPRVRARRGAAAR